MLMVMVMVRTSLELLEHYQMELVSLVLHQELKLFQLKFSPMLDGGVGQGL